jgi:hypothetical protein
MARSAPAVARLNSSERVVSLGLVILDISSVALEASSVR